MFVLALASNPPVVVFKQPLGHRGTSRMYKPPTLVMEGLGRVGKKVPLSRAYQNRSVRQQALRALQNLKLDVNGTSQVVTPVFNGPISDSTKWLFPRNTPPDTMLVFSQALPSEKCIWIEGLFSVEHLHGVMMSETLNGRDYWSVKTSDLNPVAPGTDPPGDASLGHTGAQNKSPGIVGSDGSIDVRELTRHCWKRIRRGSVASVVELIDSACDVTEDRAQQFLTMATAMLAVWECSGSTEPLDQFAHSSGHFQNFTGKPLRTDVVRWFVNSEVELYQFRLEKKMKTAEDWEWYVDSTPNKHFRSDGPVEVPIEVIHTEGHPLQSLLQQVWVYGKGRESVRPLPRKAWCLDFVHLDPQLVARRRVLVHQGLAYVFLDDLKNVFSWLHQTLVLFLVEDAVQRLGSLSQTPPITTYLMMLAETMQRRFKESLVHRLPPDIELPEIEDLVSGPLVPPCIANMHALMHTERPRHLKDPERFMMIMTLMELGYPLAFIRSYFKAAFGNAGVSPEVFERHYAPLFARDKRTDGLPAGCSYHIRNGLEHTKNDIFLCPFAHYSTEVFFAHNSPQEPVSSRLMYCLVAYCPGSHLQEVGSFIGELDAPGAKDTIMKALATSGPKGACGAFQKFQTNDSYPHQETISPQGFIRKNLKLIK